MLHMSIQCGIQKLYLYRIPGIISTVRYPGVFDQEIPAGTGTLIVQVSRLKAQLFPFWFYYRPGTVSRVERFLLSLQAPVRVQQVLGTGTRGA